MQNPLIPDRLVLYPELKTIFGVPYSIQHLGRLERANKFPKRMRLSSQRVAWRAGDVLAWIQNSKLKVNS